jgi:hypothetical protein
MMLSAMLALLNARLVFFLQSVLAQTRANGSTG